MCELYKNGVSSLRLGPTWIRMRPALRVMGWERTIETCYSHFAAGPETVLSNGLGAKIATGNRDAF